MRYLAALLITATTAAFASASDAAVRVAVFKGSGVGASHKKLIEALKTEGDRFEVSRVTAEQARGGGLTAFDVLVHPGGSASKQGQALEPAGRAAVRDFVRQGGGYLGVCAGAYLATNDYDWSLHLLDAKVVDRRHWDRGKGPVQVDLSEVGGRFFAQPGRRLTIHYAQGPLLGRREWDDPATPDYESLAVFATEVAKNGAPRGVMAGTSAAVRANFGAGRVLCFSPHPELTSGLQQLIPISVTWLADRQQTAPAQDAASP